LISSSQVGALRKTGNCRYLHTDCTLFVPHKIKIPLCCYKRQYFSRSYFLYRSKPTKQTINKSANKAIKTILMAFFMLSSYYLFILLYCLFCDFLYLTCTLRYGFVLQSYLGRNYGTCRHM
jgi:hypothetical protein